MKQNAQQQQENLALALIIVVVLVVIIVGISSDWSRNVFFMSLLFSTIIGMFIYTFRPRKCLNCKVYMKRKVTKYDHVIYNCNNCGNVIDTKVGLDASP